ncbi:MAG TPA: PAS domain S-box protein [Verrucomicrobiae bacterium]|nr:PAS domain S-box protein [Verrucomicrobiae bacterium]
MKGSVENKILAGFVASVAALMVIGWLAYRTTNQFITTDRLVAHTHEVIATLESGRAILTDVEARQRAFLLTGDEQFLKDSNDAQAQINAWMERVKTLTADNPGQQQRLTKLESVIAQRMTVLNSRIKLRQQGGLQAVSSDVATLRQGQDLMDQVWRDIAQMRDTENSLLSQRQQVARTSAETSLIAIFTGGAFACAIGLAAVLLIRRDLKLREQTEKSLRQSEQRLRLMIESVKDYAIIMLDPAGRVVSWNVGAQRIKGYNTQEIIGRHFSCFYPEEAVRSRFPEKALAEAAAKGRFENEGWRVREDGLAFWANVVISAIHGPEGQLLGFAKVTRDLTEHKRAEQALEERDRFFDLSRDVICLATFDGYFKTLNPAWERTLGFSREELMAKPFIEFIHPDDVPASQVEVEKLASGQETVNFENRYRCKDGSWRWFAWNARAAVPQRLIYATGRDITERKRTQAQITQLNGDLQNRATQLEAANKELEAFSYSVSHDLRAPLRHIDGFVKLLNKQAGEKLDERGRRYLGIIADSARQMGMLIDDLLVFSRMNRAELRQAKVSTDALVHEAIGGLQSEIDGRPINWKIAPLPDVEADPAMLRQVWVNLIANAVKYSRLRNPAEIEIGCNSDNGELVFFVRDNGVGFDMQYAHKLFGVFQRLHRAEEFEGTGIGLANVRRIVHRHGGRTWAEGELDRGATFFFSLPKTSTEMKG